MTTAERLAIDPRLDTKQLVTPNSTLKLVQRGDVFVVLLDGAVVNTSKSVFSGQLFARHVRREIEAKRANAKRVAA
jgi:hypothetical protein